MQLTAINVSHATDLNLCVLYGDGRDKGRKMTERESARFLPAASGVYLCESRFVSALHFSCRAAQQKSQLLQYQLHLSMARPLWLRFMELLHRTKSYNHSQKRNCGAEGRASYTFSIVVAAFLGVSREMGNEVRFPPDYVETINSQQQQINLTGIMKWEFFYYFHFELDKVSGNSLTSNILHFWVIAFKLFAYVCLVKSHSQSI
jgi:hypothetical protein